MSSAINYLLSLPNHPYAVTGVVTFVLSALLAIFVVWKNPKSSPAKLWSAMCCLVALWSFWNTFSLLSPTTEGSIKFLRISDAFALFIPIVFLHFTMHFSGQIKPTCLKLGYGVTCLVLSTINTPLFLRGGKQKFGIWFEDGGPAFAVFAFLYILFASYGIFLLYRAYKKAQGIRKAQLISLIIAASIGFSGGFMWFPPALGIDIPPLGGHLIALYCVIVAYAIIRYRFLDIQIIIRRSLVYSLLITFLTAGYFGLVYAIERAASTTLGYKSPWISLSAFALMTLTFQPLKIGIQRIVDWIIFRVPQEELVRRMDRLEGESLQSEKQKAIATLAAGMAHEIKNPLTALKIFAEFIPEKHQDPAFAKKLHEVLTTETQRIQGIVQELLEFSKPKPPRLKPLDLESLVGSTIELLSSELAKKNIRWDTSYLHKGIQVQADSDQFRQILINLIQNAADAMPNGGLLKITTQTNGDYLELKISDTGEGIPKDLLPKIFEPFVTTKATGTGLGLAMVRSLIQAHHGTICAESQHGRGTTFTIKLPL